MKDKIFVHIGHHLGLMQASTLPTSAPGEEEYIRKDALLEWAKEQWLHTRNGTMADQIRSSAYEEMIKHIESL